MKRSDGTKFLAAALVKFQSEAPKVTKDSTNPHFMSRYASLEAIIDACRDKLAECGLAILQLPGQDEWGNPTLVTCVMHSSGEYVESPVPLLLAKQDPQGLASAITYMCRYARCSSLGIALQDDDGEEASKKPIRTKEPEKLPSAATFKSERLAEEEEVDDGMATQKQCNMLLSLQHRLGYSDEDIANIAKEVADGWAGDFHGLTKGQASSLIDALK